MKAIHAGLASAVPVNTILNYLYNCNRPAETPEYYIPANTLADVQVYIPFSTIAPSAVTTQIVDLCTLTASAITPSEKLIGKDPENNYYGVFRFCEGTMPQQFSILIDVTISGVVQRYFSEAYKKDNCEDTMKIEACFPPFDPNGENAINNLGFDCNEIYSGLPVLTVLGSSTMRYWHYALVRKGKVTELPPKATFSSNFYRNFKTIIEKQFEVRTEGVPNWYKDYLLAIYSRGFIQVQGNVYQVTDLSFEGTDDDDLTWKPYAKCKKETRHYFGCDATSCNSDAPCESMPDDCCTPTGVSATTVTDGDTNLISVTFIPCSPAPANGYKIMYRPVGGTSYRDGGTFTSSPAVIEDANDAPGTLYEGYIYSDCGVNTGPHVPWTTTALTCNGNYTDADYVFEEGFHEFTLSGGSLATGDQIDWQIADETNQIVTSGSSSDNTITTSVSLDTDNTCYTLRWRKHCANGAYSAYNNITFGHCTGINWSYTNYSGVGYFKILVNGVLSVNETESGLGDLDVEPGDHIEVIVQTTLEGSAYINITGTITYSSSEDHINSYEFDIPSGFCFIEGVSDEA